QFCSGVRTSKLTPPDEIQARGTIWMRLQAGRIRPRVSRLTRERERATMAAPLRPFLADASRPGLYGGREAVNSGPSGDRSRRRRETKDLGSGTPLHFALIAIVRAGFVWVVLSPGAAVASRLVAGGLPHAGIKEIEKVSHG